MNVLIAMITIVMVHTIVTHFLTLLIFPPNEESRSLFYVGVKYNSFVSFATVFFLASLQKSLDVQKTDSQDYKYINCNGAQDITWCILVQHFADRSISHQ
jgi:hypothetical protein